MAQQTSVLQPEPEPVVNDSRARIVETLWTRPGSTRADLARLLNVDRSTLSRSTGRLLDSGMIEERAVKESGPRGGRPAIGLAVRGDWGVWAGLELMPDGYRGVLVDFAGVLRRSVSSEEPVKPDTLQAVLRRFRRRVASICDEEGLELRGAGIAVPGPVRPGTGIVERSRPLGIEESLDMAASARDAMGVESIVDKDVFCACRSEIHFVRRNAVPNFLYLLAEERRKGLALGLGMVFDGRLHRGDHGAGGEILSVFRSDGRDQLSIDSQLLSRAGRDIGVLKNVVAELGPQIALMVNTLDIDRVILGGLFRRDFDVIGPMFRRRFEERRTYPGLARPEVVHAHRGDDAVAYGAAVHFTEYPAHRAYWRTT